MEIKQTATESRPIDPRSNPLFYRSGTQRSRAKAMDRYYAAMAAQADKK